MTNVIYQKIIILRQLFCLYFVSLSIKTTNQKSIFILSHIIISSNYLSINILNKKRAFTGSHLILTILFHNRAGIGIRNIVSGQESLNVSCCCCTVKPFYNTFPIIGNLSYNGIIGYEIIFAVLFIFPCFAIE